MKLKVLDVLRKENRPIKSQEISDLSGVSKKDVDKIIKELKAEEKIFSPKRCYYSVKE